MIDGVTLEALRAELLPVRAALDAVRSEFVPLRQQLNGLPAIARAVGALTVEIKAAREENAKLIADVNYLATRVLALEERVRMGEAP